MKKRFFASLLILFTGILWGQKLPFNAANKPFYHGVASGDPLEDRVIIWTRVTPDKQQTIEGSYVVATDTALKNIVIQGHFTTDSARDYTVKIDVLGLQSNSTYYYAFYALGKRSFVGRTKTTPSVGSNNLTDAIKLAVASCANYEDGYFNAYAAMAERNDLDAVIHLGDYYYEYAAGTHRNLKFNDPKRNYIPAHVPVTKADYRLRHSLYRLDPDLQRLHQQHVFIAIWDDHEVANNAYENGAKTNKKMQSIWKKRKKAAQEAYLEWMPVRTVEDNTTYYRAISYGKLMDLFLLDTRLEGRQKQPKEFDEPQDSLKPRRMISQKQFEWLTGHLKSSEARWKVIGSQVIFSDINLGFAALLPRSRSIVRIFQNLFLDTWQGYKEQRNSILDTIKKNNISNVVIVSADSHNAWAFDLNKKPVLYPILSPRRYYLPKPNPFNAITGEGYDPETGKGALGVEFSAPSITSTSFTNILTPSMISHWETKGNAPHPHIKDNPNYNPHLKYIDLNHHGYFVLDVRADSVQCDYFFVRTITKHVKGDYWVRGLVSHYNSNRLTNVFTLKQAAEKQSKDIPAPFPKVIEVIDTMGRRNP